MSTNLLPEDLQTVPELLVFLRGSLYDCYPAGKRRRRSTAWRRMRAAAVWSDFNPLVMDYLAQFGFNETRCDYDPTWEPALRGKGANPLGWTCGKYAQVLEQIFANRRIWWGRRPIPEQYKGILKNALHSWDVKQAYVLNARGVHCEAYAEDFDSETHTARMKLTHMPCLIFVGRLVLPCWGI